MTEHAVLRRSSALLLAVLLGLTLIVPASAEPSSEELREQAAVAQQRLDDLEEELSLAVENYLVAEEITEGLQREIDAIEDELRGLGVEFDELSEVAADHVRMMYMHGPTIEVSTVFIGGDIIDAGARAATLRRILDSQRIDLEALGATRTTIEALETELLSRYDQAADNLARMGDLRAEVEDTIARQQDEIDELNAEIQVALAREEEERRREEERLRREAEERRRQEELERQRAAEREAAAAAAAEQASSSGGSSGGSTSSGDGSGSSSGGSTSSGESSSSSSGGSSSGGDSGGSSTASEPAPSTAPAVRGSAQVAIDTALAQLGKPYQWGGNGPGSFDCSGLMVYSWRAAGVSLPRSSSAQFNAVTRIPCAQAQPGDLVFYHQPVSHVAMFIGGTSVVEAPNSGGVVRIRQDGMTRSALVGCGRP